MLTAIKTDDIIVITIPTRAVWLSKVKAPKIYNTTPKNHAAQTSIAINNLKFSCKGFIVY